MAAERAVAAALASVDDGDADGGVPLQFVWEGTLHHLDDLGFNPLTDIPPVFTQYRKRMEGRDRDAMAVRQPLPPLPSPLPPLPVGVPAATVGVVPSLADLGLDAADAAVDSRAALDVRGGETAATARLTDRMKTGDHLRHYKETRATTRGQPTDLPSWPRTCLPGASLRVPCTRPSGRTRPPRALPMTTPTGWSLSC